MNKLRVIAFILVSLVVGFFAGRQVYFVDVKKLEETYKSQSQVNSEAAKQACDQDMIDFKKRFKDITAEQIKDYLNTQSAAEKLKKADEILAQVMKIFIAQIGLQLSVEDMNQFGKTTPSQPIPEPKVAAEPSPKQKDAEDRHVDARLASRRRDVRNANEAQKFTRMLGDNYSERISDSVILKPDQVRQLLGAYEGEIRFDDKKTVQKVEMDFNGRLEKNRYIEGSFSLKIYDADGKLINSTSGSGNISKNLSGNDNEIFVEAGRYYLQLSYFSQAEAWGGNYLESDKGKFTKLGSVYLRKR